MDIYTTIIFLLSSVLSVYALKITIEVFLGNQKRTPMGIMLPYILFYIVINSIFIAFYDNMMPATTLATNVILYLVITQFYQSTFLKRLVAVVSVFLLRVVVELLFVIAFVASPAPATTPVEQNSILFVVMALLSYMVALVLRRFKNIKENKNVSPILWIAVFVIPAVSLFISFIVIANVSQVAAFAIILGIFGVNLLTFYLFDSLSAAYEDKLKSALHAQEKEYYYSQIQLMQESHEHIKAIRHDIKTHLGAVRGYSIEINANEITDYVSSLLGDVSKDEVYCDTGNIAFDSIINFKLKNAKERNIRPKLHMSIPRTLNIEVSDIVTILGNLLDNALDAADKAPDKMLRIDIEYNRGCLFIKVDNSFDGEVKYKTQRASNEKHIATHKEPSEHGHGLKNIRKAVQKYNGKVDIGHEGNVFSVAILIYVDDRATSDSL